MAQGIRVTYDTIRDWVARVGIQILAKFRRDKPRPVGKWQLDEVVVSIKGRKHWRWWAADTNGDVLDILAQSRRNKAAAVRFFRKLFNAWGQQRVIITDKLRSYGAATADPAPGIEHHQHKVLNNRAEASHRQTRRREKTMGRFKSPGQSQRFLSVHDQTAALLRPKRHRLSAIFYRHASSNAFDLLTGYTHVLSA